MSISTANSSISYVGNASASTPYVVNFPFFDATDLTVYVTTASGVVSTLTPSQFSVTGGAGSNGNVVTTAAVPATSTVTITRNVP
jgi:hypothetical protein